VVWPPKFQIEPKAYVVSGQVSFRFQPGYRSDSPSTISTFDRSIAARVSGRGLFCQPRNTQVAPGWAWSSASWTALLAGPTGTGPGVPPSCSRSIL
jgi:hypothetical protein